MSSESSWEVRPGTELHNNQPGSSKEPKARKHCRAGSPKGCQPLVNISIGAKPDGLRALQLPPRIRILPLREGLPTAHRCRLKISPVLGILSVLLFAGCMGYHLGPVLKADYKSVAVVMFKNRTLQPQLEAQVSNGIIKRLQSDGTLRVESKEDADIILTGQILHYRRAQLRALRTEALTPREYRLFIDARVEARNRVTGDLVLKPTVVTGSADTFIGTDLESAEEQALPLIADDLARQVVSLLTESWQ